MYYDFSVKTKISGGSLSSKNLMNYADRNDSFVFICDYEYFPVADEKNYGVEFVINKDISVVAYLFENKNLHAFCNDYLKNFSKKLKSVLENLSKNFPEYHLEKYEVYSIGDVYSILINRGISSNIDNAKSLILGYENDFYEIVKGLTDFKINFFLKINTNFFDETLFEVLFKNPYFEGFLLKNEYQWLDLLHKKSKTNEKILLPYSDFSNHYNDDISLNKNREIFKEFIDVFMRKYYGL